MRLAPTPQQLHPRNPECGCENLEWFVLPPLLQASGAALWIPQAGQALRRLRDLGKVD